MEIESAHPLGQKQVELHGNSVEGQTVWSGDTWLQSPGKAALPEQLQVAVEQLQYKRDGCLGWMQSLKCGLEGQHQTLEMLLQECRALKAQLRQSKAVTQEQERERALQIEWHQHTREQLRQAEASVHILESSLDLYKKKYQAALGRAGGLERQVHHLQGEARRKAARRAEKPDNPWSSGQAEDSLGQLGAREIGWDMQLTGQQDQTAQELQEQLAASHSKLLQQKEAVAALRREFASYKLTHSCSNTKHRKQMVSQAMLHQKLQQAGEAGLQQQAEAYQALVQELKLQLAREAEQNSRTLKDLARLELAVQSLCQEAATEQSRQLRELAVLQHQACPVQALLEQSHQLCAQKEWKAGRPIQRAWANCCVFWDQARLLNAAASQEAKQGRAASWSGGVPVLQLRRPKKPEEPQKAAVETAQDQPVKRDLQLHCLGKDGCRLELLLGRGCLGEAELEQKSFLGGGLPAAAATSAREQLKELTEERSRSKQQPLQAAAMLELEMLQQQLQETEWRVQALQACVMEQKAESRSLQEQLTKQTAVLGLVHGRFRQAWLQLQHQATKQIDSLQISLEASRAGHHWLHQESELVVADVRQWVKEQKQMNEELGHKLRMQIKQIAQLTGERDLLHQLWERLQEDNQQLKNEVKEKRLVCERMKALHKSDLEPQAVLQQLWHILLL
ncbi:polyamine-modulated factor 1-binding protein 1 [Pseudonaja textilis]|uniref:polyamine-modulated factor 1-binding protein 1 n=1 Tax=Pseudonaja textilis TaxID=8673 RepID=UPI000EA8DBDF|nr:polyamine-modulated factor 1-binding protein 1 [Pseudonaja textilis]